MTTIQYENKRERKNKTKSQLNNSHQEISMQTVKKAIKNLFPWSQRETLREGLMNWEEGKHKKVELE
jgi:hypothetical protein